MKRPQKRAHLFVMESSKALRASRHTAASSDLLPSCYPMRTPKKCLERAWRQLPSARPSLRSAPPNTLCGSLQKRTRGTSWLAPPCPTGPLPTETCIQVSTPHPASMHRGKPGSAPHEQAAFQAPPRWITPAHCHACCCLRPACEYVV
jgi:hypothetical protein